MLCLPWMLRPSLLLLRLLLLVRLAVQAVQVTCRSYYGVGAPSTAVHAMLSEWHDDPGVGPHEMVAVEPEGEPLRPIAMSCASAVGGYQVPCKIRGSYRARANGDSVLAAMSPDPLERAAGVALPVAGYPLFEQALRKQLGHSITEVRKCAHPAFLTVVPQWRWP